MIEAHALSCRLRRYLAAAPVLFGVLLSGGCTPKQAQPGAGDPPPPEVAVVTITPQEVRLTTELPGRTAPYLVAEIRPQVSGIIRKRLFQEGANVGKDDVLYEIEPAPFQAAFDNAKASLARSEANVPAIRARVERYKDLLADKAVSEQDLDDAAAALKQAEADSEYWKAALEAARINLGFTKITAPIAGRIGRSGVTDGALVTAHQPMALATIQQLDPIYVDVPQSTVQLLRLRARLKDGRLSREGANVDEVALVQEDGTPYALPGRMQFQEVTVDPTMGSVFVRILFPNPEGVLLPHMFVRAVLQEGVNKAGILVPQQSVARDVKGNPIAMLVDDSGKVQRCTLTLERAIGDKWLVSSGLKAGDRVIAEGLQKARVGAIVRTVPFNGAKSN